MRKRTHRKPQTGMHPMDTLTACQVHPPQVADRILLKLHSAYEHLKTGGTDDELFDRVGAAMNVGLIRAEQIGGMGSPGVQVFLDAQAAVMQCDALRARHGRYGFTGPGLEFMAQALALYEEIVRASTPMQMHLALQEVIRRVKAGHVEIPLHVEQPKGAAHA